MLVLALCLVEIVIKIDCLTIFVIEIVINFSDRAVLEHLYNAGSSESGK